MGGSIGDSTVYSRGGGGSAERGIYHPGDGKHHEVQGGGKGEPAVYRRMPMRGDDNGLLHAYAVQAPALRTHYRIH